ncbi:hypothetical protein F3Y22_tig00116925pilonHSYRG00039 [Hibiscus syriacus]|uniref:Pentatricopeptide repeat-containing protein n=1 Tax=Hibiscus syriacus TaxID=106335 RepID=A0A6A2Y0Z0_HIBSY|nr:hypothetical protein F3Y22_tig00116925pilonHSYRG00039 [Hibiscus syriacus]
MSFSGRVIAGSSNGNLLSSSSFLEKEKARSAWAFLFLTVLMFRGQTEAAQSLTKSLLSSKSPLDLLNLFSVTSPRLKLVFSNVLFSLLAQTKMCAEAMELHKAIMMEDMRPSITSLNSLLDCLVSSKQFGKTLGLFEEISGSGFRPNKFMYGKAIQAALKLGDLKRANGFLNCMNNEGVGELEKAFGLKERMVKESVEPNIVTFHTLAIDEAKRVLKEMEAQGFAADGYTFNILFDGFLKSEDVESASALKAEEVLHNEIVKGIVPNEVVFNTIMNGYCRIGDMDRPVSMVERMEKLGLRPDCVTFNTLIDKFFEMKEMDNTEERVKKTREEGVSPNLQTDNILINGYGKMKVLDRCFAIIEEMEMNGIKPNSGYNSRGVLPNVLIYNMLIDGNCAAGHVTGAFSYFGEMVKGGTRPTIVTFNTLINEADFDHLSCSHHWMHRAWGRRERISLHHKMIDQGISPEEMTYNSLILGQFKRGNLLEIKDLVGDMRGKGLVPKGMLENHFLPLFTTCNELVIGLRKEGRLQEAQIFCSEMKAKGMDHWSSGEDLLAAANIDTR